LNKDGSGYVTLHSFNLQSNDGLSPQAKLIEGSDRALYGTTLEGGTGDQGTVFKLSKDGGGYMVLHHFTSNAGDVWGTPEALLEGSDGGLYGTTSYGGSNAVGSVFKLNKDGTGYMILYSFGNTNNSLSPSGLIEGRGGWLYGTTSAGGSAGVGTVFKLKKDGTGYSVLRSFAGNDGDGQYPHGGLVLGSDNALYGTTLSGGRERVGTVFRLNPDGSGYGVLRSFSKSGGDGFNPNAALVEGSDGALYGATEYGGTTDAANIDGAGIVFKLNKDGSGYTVLHRFSYSGGDGGHPAAGLIKGSDGALYGTTLQGGDLNRGTVFKLFSSTPLVSVTRMEFDGTIAHLSLSGGAAGQTFQLQTSTNLASHFWQAIATNQFGIDGKSQFLDTGASNNPIRFYRSATF
jgi:uncharacterized repeat protein (TIGR03803 family)